MKHFRNSKCPQTRSAGYFITCSFPLVVAAVVMVCALFLWISVPDGCAQVLNASGAQAKTIVDAAGRSVGIPRNIGRVIITCYGGAAQEVSVLGGADAIIAQPSTQRFPQLYRMYPRFAATPDTGSFDTVNIEHIIALKPDLVIAGITSLRGNKKIEDSGIPVVTVAIGRADIDGLLKEFSVMGRVFGSEKRADALVSYWKERLSYIRKRVSGVPARKRKKVFYMGSEAPLSTEGRLWWGQHFISAAGGVNVSRDIGPARQVTVEQLLVWNPDVIVAHVNGDHVSAVSSVIGNPKMKNVKAVRGNDVYSCPVGAFWWDRPSPEAILGIMWLAKVLYPKLMKDLDLRKETFLFYKQFYGYNLSGREYTAFF